ncbi:MAG: hypothetical protein CUN48_15585 [Candidatus Thermofonsia Clade 3 bacterium]|uniref:Uncharacterized protein n=1 Tax=Candidatus Thermofonsia Clade 3 bacterium TaxID=2364212 RepID=A0A2M8Q8F6_9CHLR|nr:MAG: hypothetical protein CUN48_15585 [Candidatus Thermofonsia Clade 3 bacterium]
MRQSQPYWRDFLRHRYRAHVQGWLVLAIGIVTLAYLDTMPQEPLWLALLASLLAAVFVVSVGVAAAALLRFPWWFLAPLATVSMAIEWGLRRLLNRPWRRRPQARSWALSNPFAWWQGRSLRKQREKRRSPTRLAPVIPLPTRPAARPLASGESRIRT